MAEELIDIFDESLRPRGVASKRLAHSVGLWHFSIHCWIYRVDAEGAKLVFQRRSPTKDLFPGCLDITAAGHYRTGETARDGVREIAEEIGLRIDFDDLIELGIRTEVVRFDGMLNREFCRVFLLRDDRPIEEYNPVDGEVDGLVEISVVDGLSLFSGGESEIDCRAVMWENGTWVPTLLRVTRELFIPRYDPYYYKVFALVDHAESDYPHLMI